VAAEHVAIIGRVQTIVETHFRLAPADWLTLACVVGLLAAAILGTYFVQTASPRARPMSSSRG
jgi:hypothetical protein